MHYPKFSLPHSNKGSTPLPATPVCRAPFFNRAGWTVFFIFFLNLLPYTGHAQADTIFKYDKAHRLFEFDKIFQVTYYHSRDTMLTCKSIDSVIAFGEKNDADLAWYAKCMKLYYLAFKENDEKKIISNLYALEKWADDCPVKLVKAVTAFKLGYSLFLGRQYPEAFNLMLQAQRMFEEIGLENVPSMFSYLYYLSSHYYNFGDYKNAIKYANLAEKYPSLFSRLSISNSNTLGMAYLKLGDYEKAKTYFLTTISKSQKYYDTVWTGIASGNYGNALMQQNRYNEAISYLLTDYNINNKVEKGNTGLTAVRLAECYVKTGQLQNAKFYIEQSQRLKDYSFELDVKRSNLKNLFRYYSAIGDISMANRLADTFMVTNDSVNNAFSTNMLASTEKRVETETRLTALALSEQKERDDLAKKNIIIVAVSILLCMVLLLLYLKYRGVQKDKKLSIQQQQFLQLEKKATEERLHYAEELLNTHLKNITEKNELVMKASSGLQDLQSDLGSAAQNKKLETLSTLFQFTILTEEDWQKFKELFDIVHPFFFTRLKDQFPSLTPSELRLLALLKLNLSNKEMSSVLGVSPGTITRGKYRLRIKLKELNYENELEQFVTELQ